ncbi:unnamed protein product [Mytilus edulis]|uniref:Pol-like protein n=1 Tax=Mytilus edulis TaxID=6550 RepID=A0A8S3QYY5_MYTED|nr:unnamed protein product [Mytilus edulis]
MRLLFINAQSFKTAVELKDIVRNYDIDILCINETFESKQNPLKFENWQIFSSPRPDKSRGGSAICIKPNLEFVAERRQQYEKYDFEMVCLEIKDQQNKKINLWVPYITPENTEHMKKLCLEINTQKLENLVILGDLNAKSFEWNNKTENKHGELLEQCMTKTSLICVNDGQATRRNCDSIIDLALISQNIYNIVEECTTLTHEKVTSDHICIMLDLNMGSKKGNSMTSNKDEENWNIRKCNWEEWKETTEEYFKDMLLKDDDSLEVWYECFESCMTACMEQVIPKYKYHQNRPKVKHPVWWNEDVKLAKKELNKTQRHFKERSIPQNFNKIIDAEKNLEVIKDKAQNEWSTTLCDVIGSGKTPKERWGAFKKLTKKTSDNKVLPFIKYDGNVIFDEKEKSKELEKVFFGGKHLDPRKFDNKFYEETTKEYINITLDSDNQEMDDDKYNQSITMDELEGSIFRLKKETAPGPDGFFPELFINAGKEFLDKLLEIMNRSWEEGILPQNWKMANVKFLKKAHKLSYNNPSAYRPISLTSVVSKLMERIVLYRIEEYVETNNIIDNEQEGFRQYRSTVNALLSLIQSIYGGFNKKMITLALFIDFEKAYDSIWREGLLVKLYQYGIKGKIWKWVHSFLNNREAVININNTKGELFKTHTGLPQGSVLSPILFNIFIADIFQTVLAQKCKFADDATIWHTGEDINILQQDLQTDIDKVNEWSNKWRMKLSVEKTEYCIFSKSIQNTTSVLLKLGNGTLKHNNNPKILGVTLDQKLTFNTHIDNVLKTAKRSLGIIREIKGIANIPTKRLIEIYQSLVCSTITYASCVWQIGTSTNLHKLDEVQRHGLALCLNMPSTSSLEVLQIIGGVLPLELRREEIAIRELAKITSSFTTVPIKKKLENWKTESNPETYISPIGKMILQADDMKKETSIEVNNIEQQYECRGMCAIRRAPEYWTTLGSSKTRTSEQAIEGQRLIKQQLEELPPNTTVAFTDGSCMGNPGPCGAGAIIYNNEEEETIQYPVSNRGSILLAELVAIKLVLEKIDNYNYRNVKQLNIYSDSQSAIGIITLNWKSENYHKTIQEIKNRKIKLEQKGFSINIIWTPGHSDIEGNEQADRLAKAAAKEADNREEMSSITTKQDIKQAARTSVIKKWKTQWESSEVGRRFFNHHPDASKRIKLDFPSKKHFNILNSLRSGYSKLKGYQHFINRHVEDNKCTCGEIESVEHFLLSCDNYSLDREKLRQSIYFKT